MMGSNDRRQEAVEAKREAAASRRQAQAEWRGYINVDLSVDEKKQFEEWVRGEDPWQVLQEVVVSGCVVSVKANGSGGGFLGSVTQKNAGSVNSGLAITARSSDAWRAVMRALFLVAHLGVEADWSAGSSIADPDRW